MKKFLKTLYARSCFTLRLPALLSLSRRKAPILCYHRVIPEGQRQAILSSPWLLVSQGSFERQMRYLKDHCHLLSLAAFLQFHKHSEALPKRAVIVTFDDGWEDNYLYAFPILERYQIPATIFLTAGFMGTERLFWPEKVSFCLAKLRGSFHGATGIPEFFRPYFDRVSRHPDRAIILDELIEEMKRMDPTRRARLISEIERLLPETAGAGSPANRLMNWGQVVEMHKAGIHFGSHGMTHRLLTQLSAEEITEEVRASKTVIEEKLQTEIDMFAYPNGNYNDAIIRILREAGYKLAVTTEPGLNAVGTDPLRLKRKCLDDRTLADHKGRYSEAVFEAHLTGLL